MKLIHFLATILLVAMVTSCELIGLDLQQDYKFIPSKAHSKLNMNAYEFIKSRKDIDMLFMYTAIEKAGIQNWYNDSVSNTTFLVLNDDALKAYMTSKAKLHITDFTDIELRNYFKQTICKGKHLTINLGNNDLKVETIQPNYFVYFRVAEITGTAQLPSAWYTLLINGSAGIKTSNLETTNGVVHVFSKDFNRGTYVPH